MPHLVIRPFEVCDQPAVRRLVLEGLGAHFGFVDETANPDLDDILASYVEPDHHFVVAQIGGEIVGSGALVDLGNAVGRLVRMSVRADHRRTGIGRALVDHLLYVAHQRGYRCVQVDTNKTWPDAIGLYLSCGFVEYDRDHVSLYLATSLAQNTPVNEE
jgi:GNAT superfamily N-acetyltransferase